MMPSHIYDQERLEQAKALVSQGKRKCSSREHSSSIIDVTEETLVSSRSS